MFLKGTNNVFYSSSAKVVTLMLLLFTISLLSFSRLSHHLRYNFHMRKISILIFLYFVLSVGNALAQATEQSGILKTANGILIVWNEPDNFYTIEVKGNSIKPIPDHDLWFQVDGKFFQIVMPERQEFLKELGNKNIDDKAILTAYQKWESDYIAETLNSKLKINSTWLNLPNSTTALAWSYDMPHVDDKQTARKQLYLSVVKGKRVLALNTVVEGNDDEKPLQQFLLDTMSTLKPSDKPLSLGKAREQILKHD
jgi:hypothetical protein